MPLRSEALRLLATAVVLAGGCGGEASRPAGDPSSDLPGALTRVIPAGAEVAHYESAGEPMPYRLWIVHGTGGALITFPKGLRGFERHDLPASTLSGLIESKASWLSPGAPAGGACRFSHWEDSGAEYRVREFVTDRGWFASLEQLGGPIGSGAGDQG